MKHSVLDALCDYLFLCRHNKPLVVKQMINTNHGFNTISQFTDIPLSFQLMIDKYLISTNLNYMEINLFLMIQNQPKLLLKYPCVRCEITIYKRSTVYKALMDILKTYDWLEFPVR